MDFYEIDSEVVRLAKDTRYFTFLKNTPATVRTIVGDGRLQMAKAPDGRHGIILGGLLVFNVRNRKLNLAPVLGATAQAAGLRSLTASDDGLKALAATSSVWVAVARTDSDLEPLRALGGRWQDIPKAGPVWTDSYSSLARVLNLF